MTDHTEDIKTWLKAKRSATWGRAFDLTTNLNKAAEFIEQEMSDLIEYLDSLPTMQDDSLIELSSEEWVKLCQIEAWRLLGEPWDVT